MTSASEQTNLFESWFLKVSIPESSGAKALWLRFSTLTLKSGLKELADTCAVFFDQDLPGRKVGVRYTTARNLANATNSDPSSINMVRIGESIIDTNATEGQLSNRQNSISWKLKISANSAINKKTLSGLNLANALLPESAIDVRFTGSIVVNGKNIDVSDAPGTYGHHFGRRFALEWAWAHANAFEQSTPAAIEIISGRSWLGNWIAGPRMTALTLEYKGDRYDFNRLQDALSIQSRYSLTGWEFAAERGSLRVSGKLWCDLRDLIGITLEDTEGSYIYCNNSELASMDLSIYYKGKLDTTLRAKQTAGIETVSRQKNQYVEAVL